jgi:nucleotide-binding universal stress UspA family protein
MVMYKRILLAVNQSVSSQWALDAAVAQAHDGDAVVRVVCVPGAEADPRGIKAKEVVDAAVAELRAEGIEAEGHVHPDLGSRVVPAVLDEVDDFAPDLLVVGTSWLRDLPNRVPELLAAKAPCSVLIAA